MAGNGMSKTVCRRAIAHVFTCALLLPWIGPDAARAATVVYDFSSSPDSMNLLSGAFTYDKPGTSATFEGLQYDDSGSFPDHTSGGVGAVFGTGPGPATITFSPPVDLVELYVNNFGGDFDARPDDSKLFSITASLGGTNVFTYDRAAQSTPPDGVSDSYLLIAPANPITVDSISLANFDQDTLDDLKVNVVPEPATALVSLSGLAVLTGLGRKRRRKRRRVKRRGGHAPERDPPRIVISWNVTSVTQANGVACAGSENILGQVPTTMTPVGTCT
jgi:hypothetical protein